MTGWIDAGSGHRVRLLDDGGVSCSHSTPPGYRNGSYPIPRHQVDPRPGETWMIIQREPLTLSPSLHCDLAHGGCGAHGFIRDGQWM